MDLALPMPNVLCRCGTVLFSWKDVEKHFERHQMDRVPFAEYQAAMDDVLRRKGAL